MFSFLIRTIPQDSRRRHFWVGLDCSGRESTLFLSCPAPVSLSKPQVRSHFPHSLAWHPGADPVETPQGSYCLECSPASCSSSGFPSLPPCPPPPHTPFWLLLCPAFVYKLPEVESLPHHGTHSAPRTAPEPVEALLPVPPTPDQPFQIQVRVHLLGLILMPDPAQNLDS